MQIAAKHKSYIKRYGLILLALIMSWFISMGSVRLLHSTMVEGGHAEILPIFLDIVVVFGLGFVAYELAKSTIIPSFVIAIFFGFVSQNLLSFIANDPLVLSVLTTIGAVLILFGGGLDTPFTRFKSLVGPIISIAFIGTIISAIGFSLALAGLNSVLGISMPIAAVILLGISLASTDPAAIIPCLKSLIFSQPRIKHIAISESALNDVIGALITGVFLILFLGDFNPSSIFEAYAYLLTLENLLEILKVIVVGVLAGVLGFLILHIWSKWKEKIKSEGEADAALFLAVPLFTFTTATALGGNGFLAVFVAGLLFQIKSHVNHVEHFFNHTIEGFMKPLIFMLLGTLVNFESLQAFAVPGIIMGIICMFVLRPIAVFITLFPYMKFKHKFSFKELLFLSFVRETGVIPAVLLVSIKIAGIPGSDVALVIGMWVILLTLIVQPPLTPLVAKILGIAVECPLPVKEKNQGAVAVLCSRSYTFLDRIEHVVEWAEKHGVENIMVLHCAEEKYTEKFVKEVKKAATVKFKTINARLEGENKKAINFKFVGRPGSLEENIRSIAPADDVSVIFIGSKMLDYRLDVIKQLEVPFIFVK